MTTCKLLTILSASATLLVSACAAESDTAGEFSAVDNTTAFHMLPLRTAETQINSAPAGAHLTNFGGPILTSVHVAPLFWNSSVQFQSNLNPFYNDVPNRPLYTLLSQYGGGHGNGQAGFVDNRPTRSVRDSAVQTEVLNQINAGPLPPPTANTYYPVHF